MAVSGHESKFYESKLRESGCAYRQNLSELLNIIYESLHGYGIIQEGLYRIIMNYDYN